MPRVTITVDGLDPRGFDLEFPTKVAVGAVLPRDLTLEQMEARLVDLNRALLVLLTYSPGQVAEAFPGGEY